MRKAPTSLVATGLVLIALGLVLPMFAPAGMYAPVGEVEINAHRTEVDSGETWTVTYYAGLYEWAFDFAQGTYTMRPYPSGTICWAGESTRLVSTVGRGMPATIEVTAPQVGSDTTMSLSIGGIKGYHTLVGESVNITIRATTTRYRLSRIYSPGGYVGHVSLTPSQPAGGYVDLTSVSLNATGLLSWEFDHWGGALSGTQNPQTLVMDGNKTVTAYFVSTDGNGNGDGENETYKLYGRIRDAYTEEYLKGATVEADGKSDTSDSLGYFEIKLEAGTHYVVISKGGYLNVEGEATITNADFELDINLAPAEEDFSWRWVLIALGVVLVIAGICLALRRRKK